MNLTRGFFSCGCSVEAASTGLADHQLGGEENYRIVWVFVHAFHQQANCLLSNLLDWGAYGGQWRGNITRIRIVVETDNRNIFRNPASHLT
jgi:hypothetical protein